MSLPLDNLDDKTYAQLVEEARKRIPIYAPRWTDHNIHDPGITLMELFAWLTEMQIYRLNKITDASYREFFQLANQTQEYPDIEKGIVAAREDMKRAYRAVTPGDYEYLAVELMDGQVARAKAIGNYHPNIPTQVPGIITLLVIPSKKLQVPESVFLETVFSKLNNRRLLASRLYVAFPLITHVSVKATVRIKPEFLKDTVRERIIKNLDQFLDHLQWEFGRPVYTSEIYRVIDSVEGVDYVETGSLFLKKENARWKNADVLIPPHGLVHPGTHEIEDTQDFASRQ